MLSHPTRCTTVRFARLPCAVPAAWCSGATKQIDKHASNAAQVLLPGHLLMRFTREKLEDCLAALKDGIARDAARSPEAVNLQVGCYLRRMLRAACMQLRCVGDCALGCQFACGILR